MRKVILMITAVMIAGAASAQGYKVGDKARDFKLKNVNGKMVSLADYPDAKGFIIVFSCNHCPFVKMTEDRIIALDKKYTAMGYPLIAINSNDPVTEPEDSYPEMQKRARQKNFGFPYLVDETQEIARAYGATNTPHVFLLKKEANGEYTVKYIGSIDDNTRDASNVNQKFVENAIAALEAGKDPDPSLTRAIGCTIKWKE